MCVCVLVLKAVQLGILDPKEIVAFGTNKMQVFPSVDFSEVN